MRCALIILVLAVCDIGCERRAPSESTPAEVVAARPLLQVGLVVESPAVRSERLIYTHLSADGTQTNEILNVSKELEWNETALKNGGLVWERGKYAGLDIELEGKASAEFAEFTCTNIGRRITLSVGGKVAAAPELRGEVLNGQITIARDNLQDAQALQRKLRQATAQR